MRQSRWLDAPIATLPRVSRNDTSEGYPTAKNLFHTLLATSRKHLTLSIRTLVMRDLFRRRTNLIKQYLHQHGIKQGWDEFIAHADLSHRRAIGERLQHDKSCRLLTKAKAELDRILTMQAYAECTAPPLTTDLYHTALRLVTHHLTFAEDQLEDVYHAYTQEFWEEQQEYYCEFKAILHSQSYNAAVPQPWPPFRP